MITFHPAARKTPQGYVPMVTLRADKGRMVGSKVSQHGNVFETAAEAFQHALVSALRVACRYPDLMTVAQCEARHSFA